MKLGEMPAAMETMRSIPHEMGEQCAAADVHTLTTLLSSQGRLNAAKEEPVGPATHAAASAGVVADERRRVGDGARASRAAAGVG